MGFWRKLFTGEDDRNQFNFPVTPVKRDESSTADSHSRSTLTASAPVKTPKPEVSIEELERRFAEATTVAQCIAVAMDVPEGHELETRLAQKALNLATTSEECRKILIETLDIGKELEDQITAKMEEFKNAELEAALSSANTVEECNSVREEAIDVNEDHPIVEKAFEKALVLLKTHEECDEMRDNWSLSEDEGERLQDIREKLLFASLGKQLDEAKSVEDCLELLSEISGDDDETREEDFETKALEKALSLAQTSDECSEILDAISRNTHYEHDDLDEKIKLKMITLLDTVEECAEIWNEDGIDSEEGELAICRAADIIREHAKKRSSLLSESHPVKVNLEQDNREQ